MTERPRPGELAIVLHTHMPYVEGFGTWPFGEEWLWEAIATSYLPLLEVLDDGAPVTVSLTPVLCDQFEAPGLAERFLSFLDGVRSASHEHDVATYRGRGEHPIADEVERSAADYRFARERFVARSRDLVAAFAEHARWTSSATHAVLPLLATDAGVRLQVRTGVESHRRRFGGWGGGFWLPECAHANWIEPLLEEAGVRATCVDLTDVLGRGSSDHLRPLGTDAGPTLVPIDRALVELVWSDDGYPADGAYRNYHGLTPHHHRAWANDGSVYDRTRAADRAREHAADFVARARARLADGGLAVCALDTELLGHWWFEGPAWLRSVVEEAARQGLRLAPLDEALERHPPAPPRTLPMTTWGTPRDLSTWDGPAVAELAWSAREAELRVLAAGGAVSTGAVRELLALQSSDWAFLVSRDLAEPYGRERFAGHRAGLDAALRSIPSPGPTSRALAPRATPAPLLTP